MESSANSEPSNSDLSVPNYKFNSTSTEDEKRTRNEVKGKKQAPVDEKNHCSVSITTGIRKKRKIVASFGNGDRPNHGAKMSQSRGDEHLMPNSHSS